MVRRRSGKASGKALGRLFEMGISALVVGAAMLFLPRFLSNPVLEESFERGLRMPAWIALAAGALLIALHLVTRRWSQQPEAPRQEPGWTHSQPSELARRSHSGFLATDTPPISRFKPHDEDL